MRIIFTLIGLFFFIHELRAQNCEVFREEFSGSTTFTEVDQGFASTCAFATATLFDNNGSEHVMTVYAYNEGLLRKALALPSKTYEIEVKWRFPANTQERLNSCGLTRHDDTYGANCDVPKRLVAVNQVKKYEVSGITGASTQTFKIWHNGPINELVFAVGGNCAVAEYTTYIDQVVIRKAAADAGFSFVLVGDTLTTENLSIAYDPAKVIWDFGDGSTSTEEEPTHVYSAPGTYKVCLTVSNDCSQDSICKNIEILAGIAGTRYRQFNIYPNPAQDVLFVDGFMEPVDYDLTDVQGRIMKKGRLEPGILDEIQLNDLGRGTYVLQLRAMQHSEVHTVHIER